MLWLFGQDQFPGFGLPQLIALALMGNERDAVGAEQLCAVVAGRRVCAVLGRGRGGGVGVLAVSIIIVLIKQIIKW